MPKKTQKPKKQKIVKFTPTEISLDFLKYNVYLLFKATCANAVVANSSTPDLSPSEIAAKADILAALLDTNIKL